MKVLLLEGLDNVGKSSIASELMLRFKDKYNILFMHSRSPMQENVDPLTYQSVEFYMKADTAAHMAIYEECKDTYIPENNKHPLSETLCIFDRSWLDEYVYGQIYREEPLWEILLMITNCFEALMQPGVMLEKMQVAIVYLDSTPEFSIYKDDGRSFTSDIENYTKKLDIVKREYALFNEVCNYCKENNLCDTVKVNVQASDTEYKPIGNIVGEIETELNKIGIIL
jgi:thymidylate kinase